MVIKNTQCDCILQRIVNLISQLHRQIQHICWRRKRTTDMQIQLTNNFSESQTFDRIPRCTTWRNATSFSAER